MGTIFNILGLILTILLAIAGLGICAAIIVGLIKDIEELADRRKNKNN